MESETVRRMLAEMAQVDPDRADLAESVIEWLTAGGEALLSLAGLLRFTWYELPVKWMGPPDLHGRVLQAVADLFDRLDLDRYAEVCRSPLTAEIHDAYSQSSSHGREEFWKAYRRSGVDPPDLEDFAWGSLMGLEEATALAAAEVALEEAMVAGRFSVGARGWKKAAIEVTAAVLDAPHPLIPGQTLRTAILTERLHDWLRVAEQRSARLHALRSRHINRLIHPVAVPDDVVERIEPITWFLRWVGEGTPLTQAGYLPTAMVREGCARFEWPLLWTDRPPRGESEVAELYELHELLRRIGSVRVRKNTLRVTSKGTEMGADPEVAWRMVASGLSPGEWARAAAEVYGLLLFDGERLEDELAEEAAIVLGGYGWQLEGNPLELLDVKVGWWATERSLKALGGVVVSGDWRSRRVRLTPFGEATLLEQMRADAAGPRKSPS